MTGLTGFELFKMTIGFCIQLSVISKFTSELVAKSNMTLQITPEMKF